MLLLTPRYYKVLLHSITQYYKVLHSTTDYYSSTTKNYSSTTLYYKKYCTTPVLPNPETPRSSNLEAQIFSILSFQVFKKCAAFQKVEAQNLSFQDFKKRKLEAQILSFQNFHVDGWKHNIPCFI